MVWVLLMKHCRYVSLAWDHMNNMHNRIQLNALRQIESDRNLPNQLFDFERTEALGTTLIRGLRFRDSVFNHCVESRVRRRETSMVQSRDACLVATDSKRSRRSGAVSDKPKREGDTPNSSRRAGNAQKQQTQALLTPISNECQDYMANANEGREQPV